MSKNKASGGIPDTMDGRAALIKELEAENGELDDQLNKLVDENQKLYDTNKDLIEQAEQMKGQIRDLQSKLSGSSPRVSAEGFVMVPGDPFAAGVMRFYLKRTKNETYKKMPEFLPFVLPFDDPVATEAAIQYRLRAHSANDVARVEAVTTALSKFKVLPTKPKKQ